MSIYRATLEYDKNGYDNMRLHVFNGGRNIPQNWEIVSAGDMLLVADGLPRNALDRFHAARRCINSKRKSASFYYCDMRH